jgi:hypothetical protein
MKQQQVPMATALVEYAAVELLAKTAAKAWLDTQDWPALLADAQRDSIAYLVLYQSYAELAAAGAAVVAPGKNLFMPVNQIEEMVGTQLQKFTYAKLATIVVVVVVCGVPSAEDAEGTVFHGTFLFGKQADLPLPSEQS